MNSGCIPVLPSPLITAFVYDIWNSMHICLLSESHFLKKKKRKKVFGPALHSASHLLKLLYICLKTCVLLFDIGPKDLLNH